MKKSSVVKIIISVVILAAFAMIISDFIRGFREPAVIIDNDKLIIKSSSYGVTITKHEINSVKLINEIPPLTRGNGFGVGNTQRGKVSVSNLGEGFAYVKVPNPPYIYLQLYSSYNYVFLNLNDANDTRELYGSIKSWYEDN